MNLCLILLEFDSCACDCGGDGYGNSDGARDMLTDIVSVFL